MAVFARIPKRCVCVMDRVDLAASGVHLPLPIPTCPSFNRTLSRRRRLDNKNKKKKLYFKSL